MLDGAPSERDAITRRRELVPDSARVRGLVFHAFEGLLQEHAMDAVVEQLRVALFDGKRPRVMASHPFKLQLDHEGKVAEALEEKFGGFDAAIFQCGSAAARHVLENTMAGRTARALAGGDPWRLIRAAPGLFKVMVNFGEYRFERIDERRALWVHRGDFAGPIHTAGLLDAGSRLLGLPMFQVALKEHPAPVDFTLELSWS